MKTDIHANQERLFSSILITFVSEALWVSPSLTLLYRFHSALFILVSKFCQTQVRGQKKKVTTV